MNYFTPYNHENSTPHYNIVITHIHKLIFIIIITQNLFIYPVLPRIYEEMVAVNNIINILFIKLYTFVL